MSTFHWQMRKYARELRPDGRLAVLVMLTLHANVRLRCWPGVDLLVSETGWAIGAVTNAEKWLLFHGAIKLVPYDKRVDEELKLPPRQHVYQLTGVIRLHDKEYPYLYLNPEETASLSNVSVSEVSTTEVSVSETKGIPVDEGDTSNQDISTAHAVAPDDPITEYESEILVPHTTNGKPVEPLPPSKRNGSGKKVSAPAAPPPAKTKDKKVTPQAAMLDGFIAGAGKDMMPPGFAYGPYMRFMLSLIKDGYDPAMMKTAGELYRAWWLACGKPAQTWQNGETITIIRCALQLVKMGKFPEEITSTVKQQLGSRFYMDKGIKTVKFETVAKLCRPTNLVRDAIADNPYPGLAEDPERPGVYMHPSELRALQEDRKFAQYTGDKRVEAELP